MTKDYGALMRKLIGAGIPAEKVSIYIDAYKSFTDDEILSIALAAQDYENNKGEVFKQSLKKRPLTDALLAKNEKN
jgi:hypothetical protein